MSLDSIIKTHDNPTLTNEELARVVASDIRKLPREDREEAVYTIVLTYVRTLRRNWTRTLERDVEWVDSGRDRRGAAPQAKPIVDAPPADPLASRRELIEHTVATGDGRRIPWGEATVADHKSRIAMLARIRDGYTTTIDKHLDAIEAIEAAGVRCLNDIYGKVA